MLPHLHPGQKLGKEVVLRQGTAENVDAAPLADEQLPGNPFPDELVEALDGGGGIVGTVDEQGGELLHETPAEA